MKLADEIFLKVAQEENLMSPDRVRLCQLVNNMASDEELLLDVCRKHGYLSPDQAEQARRIVDFVETSREDKEIGKEVIRRKLVKEQQVAAALRAQKKFFETGKRAPRLLNLLQHEGLVNPKQVLSINSSYEQEATISGEFVVVRGRKGGTQRRRLESRRHPRFELPEETKVNIRQSGVFWLTNPGSSWKKTTLVDLSQGGLQIKSSFPIKDGARFRIAFQIPGNGRAIQCKAIVRWVNHQTVEKKTTWYAGLQFIELERDFQTRLRALQNKLVDDNPNGSGIFRR
jgi:hypothetical protein